MSKIEKAIFTNMCLIYDDNDNILVQQRNKDTWPGLTFPGGHVEPNESFVESTIREVKEETNLEISNLKLCGITQWTPLLGGRYIVIMYKTCNFSGTIKSSDEGKVFWIPKKDLFKYELSPDLKEMFEVMDSNSLSEFFSLRKNDEEEILRKVL